MLDLANAKKARTHLEQPYSQEENNNNDNSVGCISQNCVVKSETCPAPLIINTIYINKLQHLDEDQSIAF